MSHVVTAPLVITKKEDGSDLYLYEGATVPDFVPDDEVKRLADKGMIDNKADGRKTKPSAQSN